MSLFAKNRFVTLIKRELTENRRGAIYAPAALCALLLVVMIVGMIWNGMFDANSKNLTVKALASLMNDRGAEALTTSHAGWLGMLFTIVHLVLGLVMFNYALSCLFEERKDRSTLFWRSLPVRDWETVLAKAFTLLVVLPLMYMICLSILQVLSTLVLAIACLAQGVSATELVFKVIPFSRITGWQLGTQALTSMWVFPIFAWMMLCSAYAKQRPFLLAVLLPGVVTLILSAANLSNVFAMANGKGPAAWMGVHFFGRAIAAVTPNMGINYRADELQQAINFSNLIDRLMSPAMWIGIIVGAALIYATAYIRRYREDASM
jgi:ABC-2 type transport system permease protein